MPIGRRREEEPTIPQRRPAVRRHLLAALGGIGLLLLMALVTQAEQDLQQVPTGPLSEVGCSSSSITELPSSGLGGYKPDPITQIPTMLNCGGCTWSVWSDVGCDLGGCSGVSAMQQTRTAPEPGCLDQFQCAASAVCGGGCTYAASWSDVGCDLGGCTGSTPMRQSRAAPEPGCPVLFRCAASAVCGGGGCTWSSWSDVGCYAGGCAGSTPMQQKRTAPEAGCPDEYQCAAGSCGGGCTWSSWVDLGCDLGGCSGSMQQVRTAPEAGCSPEYRCVAELCPRDGGWCPWEPCSVPCGGGTQTRTCDCPTPANGGAPCSGPSSQSCNTQSCCSCGSWAPGGCCGSLTRWESRTCTPSGCNVEERCMPDAACPL